MACKMFPFAKKCVCKERAWGDNAPTAFPLVSTPTVYIQYNQMLSLSEFDCSISK